MSAQDLIRELVDAVSVQRDGEVWIGDPSSWGGEYVFGGLVVAQATHAMTRTAPTSRRIHSLHAYFLKPVRANRPISYSISLLRDGRTFATRHLEAFQDETRVLAMTCSFTADSDGYEYELPIDPDVPGPDEIDSAPAIGPWIAARLGPTPPEADGTRRATYRSWIRILGVLPDDTHLHSTLIAFATDWTETGGRPLDLDGDTRGMISLDHAVWFHRPLRADEWFFYDVHSLINAGGRGLLIGKMYGPDRRLAVSVAQEMLLRPLDSDPR
ncbi:MAG: acyl-CoA thioesterase [Actinomycetota bacterium]